MKAGDPTQGRPSSGWSHWRVLVFLLLGLTALDVLIHAQRRLWHAYEPDDYLERIRACRRLDPDLVVVGGSPVSEGINPALLAGLHWQGQTLNHPYNLGLLGATSDDVWHAVEHGIGKPPRLLVYGITATDLNDGWDFKHGLCSLMNCRDLALWIRYRPKAVEWGLRQFLLGRVQQLWKLYYYRNAIRLWAADRVERVRPGTCPEAAAEARNSLATNAGLYGSDGYAPRPWFSNGRLDGLKSAGQLPHSFSFIEQYSIGEHLNYLHHLLDWADRSGVAVVLADMPVSADLEERMYPREFARFRGTLAELEQSRGVRVIHATRQAVGLGDADFADLIHLNASGTARFSAWLRSALDDAGRAETNR